MTVFANSNGAVYLTAKQVFPVDYESEISQRLIEAAHANDVMTALECIDDPLVDVNFVGTVSFKCKKTEIVLRGELAHQVRVDSDEFRTDVTALFLASHSGNLELVRNLISAGANVNQKVFRGYATTAAAREGHTRIVEVLISCGASQTACEEALLEATYFGRLALVEILMVSDMIRPHVAVHALVSAASRGFGDVVRTFLESGVDANASDRLLLQSSKPSLYASVNSNALTAAILSRQINIVKLLLEAGIKTDTKANMGAWWWDSESGEEFRVGAGLAEPYGAAWCAVEYFEASGTILTMLLSQISPNIPHFGRTLIHHTILCDNPTALEILINCRADVEAPVKTAGSKADFRAIHLAARLRRAEILRRLIGAGCDVNSATGFGETALMICAKHKFGEGLRMLALAGADFGLADSFGRSAEWNLEFRRVVLELIRHGFVIRSSNKTVFSPLIFVTRANDVEAVKILVKKYENLGLDEQDKDGYSAVMVAAESGDLASFEILLNAGANLNLVNKLGQTALKLSESNPNSQEFEKLVLKHTLLPLHVAAQRGHMAYIRDMISTKHYHHPEIINTVDENGNTLLMLAAREGHGELCSLLISLGADLGAENFAGESTISLLKRDGIVDEVARAVVARGGRVAKHTRGGKGRPHGKELRMVEGIGVLSWGKSKGRNVVCKEAEVGPSERFRWNRRRKLDSDVPGMFRVVTVKGKEVHFVCQGGVEMAEIWVRGIRLVTNQALYEGNRVV